MKNLFEKFPVPHAERVVGKELDPKFVADHFDEVPVNEKGEVITATAEILQKIFYEVSPQRIAELELDKTSEDIAIIQLAEKAVKEFATALGREEFVDLPIGNIHFLKEGGVEKFTGGLSQNGSHATVLGHVLIEKRTDVEMAITTFHELWHALASYNAIQVTTGGKLDWYRAGFSAKSRDAQHDWFYHLDEALVGIMTKRFVEEVLINDPRFKGMIEEMGKKNEHIDTTREREANDMLEYVEYIYEKNKDRFSSPDDVLQLFLRGQVTGNIMPAARIVEKTFGKGAFRELGKF
jgi:hypothetical protein